MAESMKEPRSVERFFASVVPLTAADEAAMREAGMRIDGCPVPVRRLVRIRFAHFTMNDARAEGSVVVNVGIAKDLMAILKELYDARFPLTLAAPIERFGGSDERSMEADNTSAFNCREKTRAPLPDGTRPPPEYSNHSYGTAIDINPLQNPYFKPRPEKLAEWRALTVDVPAKELPRKLLEFCRAHPDNCVVLPEAGRAYLDRTPRGGVIVRDGPVVRAFKKRGFEWGGDWPTDSSDKVRSDLQHFEKPPRSRAAPSP